MPSQGQRAIYLVNPTERQMEYFSNKLHYFGSLLIRNRSELRFISDQLLTGALRQPMILLQQPCQVDPSDSNARKSVVNHQSTAAISPDNLLTGLNTSQRESLLTFRRLKRGVNIIHGPPGTGKTTTLTKIIVDQAQRTANKPIMVCAPSNKAVYVLTERVYKVLPSAPMILVGVENDVPDALKPLHLDFFSEHSQQQISEIRLRILTAWHKYDETKFLAVLNTDLADLEKITLRLIRSLDLFSTAQNDFSSRSNTQFRTLEIAIAEFWRSVVNYLQWIDFASAEVALDSQFRQLVSQSKVSQTQKIDDGTPLKQVSKQLAKKLSTGIEQIRLSVNKINQDAIKNRLLINAKVIFCTLSVAGRRAFNENDIEIASLIVDEAGQALEAETLIPFARKPNKVLLCGDVHQLPPLVLSEIAKTKHFDWSMLWRMQVECQFPASLLDTQYRMHPAIRLWPSERFYQGKLKDGENISSRDQLNFDTPAMGPLALINVQGKQDKPNTSFRNFAEANQVLAVVKALHLQGIDVTNQVGVITFYAEQVTTIDKQLKPLRKRPPVNTVDSYQGDERDIIIISFVRTNGLGFVDDYRRLNVALTRPRHSLILIGHYDALSKIEKSHIGELFANLKQRDLVFDVSSLPRALQPSTVRSQSVSGTKKHSKAGKKIIRKGKQGHSSKSRKTQPCKFFFHPKQTCRKGDKCTFSHDRNIPTNKSAKAGPKGPRSAQSTASLSDRGGGPSVQR